MTSSKDSTVRGKNSLTSSKDSSTNIKDSLIKIRDSSVRSKDAPTSSKDSSTSRLCWCDRDGQAIPTGAEGQELEPQRAERLAERQRELGVDPNTL
jgi:hypothetical protein